MREKQTVEQDIEEHKKMLTMFIKNLSTNDEGIAFDATNRTPSVFGKILNFFIGMYEYFFPPKITDEQMKTLFQNAEKALQSAQEALESEKGGLGDILKVMEAQSNISRAQESCKILNTSNNLKTDEQKKQIELVQEFVDSANETLNWGS